jgi:hypothetical protein
MNLDQPNGRLVMDRDTFWQMIDSARARSNGDLEIEREIIIDELSQKSEKEIIEFYIIYKILLDETYLADLWNACDLIGCGCHENGFLYFRNWLMAQGKEIFYQAVNDPEALVSIVTPENRHQIRFEGFSYIAPIAYENKFGYEFENVELPAPVHLVGNLLEEEKLSARFPKLAAKLGDCY